MNTGYIGKLSNSDEELRGIAATDEVQSGYGDMPGVILKYNSAAQTATIQPIWQPELRGVKYRLPVLYDVPVRFQRTRHAAITMAINPGDIVTLRPLEYSTENYHKGLAYTTKDVRHRSLSDMEAYVNSSYPKTMPLEDFDNTKPIALRANASGSNGLDFDESGTMQMYIGDATKLHVSDKFSVTVGGTLKLQGSHGDIIDILATTLERLGTNFRDLAQKVRPMVD